ncbi:MAG: DNA polymerase III subunit delta [Lachnospiraceae bacterium]|jgi:DNA polymerase-3 subunit delta|nr:DNA polymerase III subunit delta [Lachnospiraceae bacterium]
MAYGRKEDPIACTKVIHDLCAAGERKKVYLLYGEERYLVNQNRDNLMKYLNPEGDTMNVNTFVGKDVNVKELIDIAETLPFFAEYRILYLENSELFSSAGEELAEYIKDAPDSTIFVFVEQNVDGRSKLYKAVNAVGVSVQYVKQTTATLETWVKSRVRREGKAIQPSVVRYFVQKTGDNMQLLEQELNKLISFAWEKTEITVADVEEICVTTLEDRIFDMIDAVSKKDQVTTLRLYHDLLALKESPVKILALLNGEFARLYAMKEAFEQGAGKNAVAEKLGVREFWVTKRQPILAKYKKEELRACFEQGVLADQQFKEGKITDRLATELLLVAFTQNGDRKQD